MLVELVPDKTKTLRLVGIVAFPSDSGVMHPSVFHEFWQVDQGSVALKLATKYLNAHTRMTGYERPEYMAIMHCATAIPVQSKKNFRNTQTYLTNKCHSAATLKNLVFY